jgi:hypothetical protein
VISTDKPFLPATALILTAAWLGIKGLEQYSNQLGHIKKGNQMQIPEHPTWHILDSSKLSTDCWRKLFYEYILGWRPDTPEHHLYFGNAWHIAREHQLLHGYDDVQGAYAAFIDYYRQRFSESTDDLFRPKDPMAVALALTKFAQERSRDLIDNKLLYTEISGTVPIDEKRVLHYRMDSVLERCEDGRIFSWDHKSATEKSMNYPWWEKNFFLGLQNGTYTHCLYCMYPIEQVIGVEFCGTAFAYLKRGSANRSQGYNITFKRVPAWKTPEQMNAWLWTINDLYDKYEDELDKLSSCKDSDPVLMAFPMNPSACSKFFGCPYHDYCMSWANPLQHCYESPLGFKQEFWDPSAMETTNKKDLKWKD